MARRKKQNLTVDKEQTSDSPKRGSIPNIFTIIGTSIAILGLFFTYLSYKKSIPQIHLENWTVEIIKPGSGYSNILLITTHISNLGGSSTSLTDSNLQISYADLMPIETLTPELTTEPYATDEANIPTGLFVAPINSTRNPNAMICEFAKQTALNSQSNIQLTPEYELTNYVCFGDGDCRNVNNDQSSSLLLFDGEKENTIKKLIANNYLFDDIPISMAPGETKQILIAWYIPYDCTMELIPVQFDVTVIFNNNQSIKLNVMDKFSKTP